MKQLYKILEVNPDTDKPALKKAYRARARQTHPDLNSGSDAAFKEVALAYRILSDDEKRKQYDETGHYDTRSKDGNMSLAQAELVRLFMETIASCNFNYTDVFEVVADKIEFNRQQTLANI